MIRQKNVAPSLMGANPAKKIVCYPTNPVQPLEASMRQTMKTMRQTGCLFLAAMPLAAAPESVVSIQPPDDARN